METYECRGCGYVMSSNEKVCKYCGSPNPIYSGSLKTTNTSITASKAPISNNSTTTNPPAKKNNKMDVGLFILLLIFFWPGALIYAIVCAVRDK